MKKKVKNKVNANKNISTRKSKKIRLSKKKLKEAVMQLQNLKVAEMIKEAEKFSKNLSDRKKEFKALNEEAWSEQRKRLTQSNPSPKKGKESINVIQVRDEACLLKLKEIINSDSAGISSYDKILNAYEFLEDYFSPLPEVFPNTIGVSYQIDKT